MGIALDIFNNSVEVLKLISAHSIDIQYKDVIKMVAYDSLETENGFNGFLFHKNGILLFSSMNEKNLVHDLKELKSNLYGHSFQGHNNKIINNFAIAFNDYETLFDMVEIIEPDSLQTNLSFVNDKFVFYDLKIKKFILNISLNGEITNEIINVDIENYSNWELELQKYLVTLFNENYYKLNKHTYFTNSNTQYDEPLLIHITKYIEL